MQHAEPDLGIDVSGARTDAGLLDVGSLLVLLVGGSQSESAPRATNQMWSVRLGWRVLSSSIARGWPVDPC
jgi:hypothetical protein